MTETSTMKVYELAKELGMDSFGLLDVLKKIGVEVKSHMSSLEAAQVVAARDFIHKPKAGAGTGAKKSIKRTAIKKAANGAAAETAPAATAKNTTVRAKAPAAKDAASDISVPGKTRVIKRRSSKEEEDAGAKIEDPGIEEHEETHAEEAQEAASAMDSVVAAEVVDPVIEETAVIAAKAAAPAQSSAPIAAREVAVEPVKEIPKAKPSTIIRKQEDPFKEDEMVDRNFIRRKLKIIQEAPVEVPKPKIDTPIRDTKAPVKKFDDFSDSSAAKGMFKPVTSVLGDQEEEGRKRRTGNSGGGNENERKVEDIKITDFRKREIIFQPKRRKLPPGKAVKKTEITTPGAHKRKIKIDKDISISELAQRMSERPNALVKKLVELGVDFGENLNYKLDLETATLVSHEFKFEIENVAFDEKKLLVTASDDAPEKMKVRPPVITVMGHVDHGKTTLLDSIRNASVASGEAGGITQHIGAYSVSIDGNMLTFLDTPGHEAFNSMRRRGANATDIVVLVVAADDGIMPQTKEAINIALEAKVPMIVAANKVDKHDANLDRLKQMLSENNVLVEEWGGQVPMLPVSALKKTGIKELLEAINLQAEILELKANPDRLAEGLVLEARMQLGRGIVADVLVQQGTLRTGDYIVCGTAVGRVRAMMNDQGKAVKEVTPGFPVEFAGLNDVPEAGDRFYCVKTEADAKNVAEHRREEIRKEKEKASERKPLTLDELFAAEDAVAGKKQLNVMLKADVFGSLEAINQSVLAIQSEKVALKVISKGVGAITDNDVIMAHTSNAHIFGFNVKPDAKAKDKAKRESVTIHAHSIIYELLDSIKETMESLLDPIRIEKPIGKAEVKQAFSVSKIGIIAGSIVLDGKITRNAWARAFRGNDKIIEGPVVSLKRFKDDVKETIKGQECGIGIEKYTDIRAGDRIEAFIVEFEKARL